MKNNSLSQQDVKNANAMAKSMNDIVDIHSPQNREKIKNKIIEQRKEQLDKVVNGLKKG